VVKPVLLIRGDNNVADQAALAKLGIASLIDPYIEIKVASDPHDAEKLLAFLSASESSLMLIATSVNALKFWSQIVGEERLRRALSSRSDLQFAAVGETTASTLRDLGGNRESFGAGVGERISQRACPYSRRKSGHEDSALHSAFCGVGSKYGRGVHDFPR
jgi:uroporphyrinogen-III synthase